MKGEKHMLITGNKFGRYNHRDLRMTPLKHTPKGCKAPRQICIRCQESRIDKRELNYDLKVCKSCLRAAAPNPALGGSAKASSPQGRVA